MNKKIAALSAALFASALALTACSGSSAAPAETVYVQVPAQEAPAPAPDAPVDTDELAQSVLADVWADISTADRESMCYGYIIDRAAMWDAFNEGAGGVISYEQWERFFGGKCT